MPRKGKQKADIQLPGGALQTTFAVERMAPTYTNSKCINSEHFSGPVVAGQLDVDGEPAAVATPVKTRMLFIL